MGDNDALKDKVQNLIDNENTRDSAISDMEKRIGDQIKEINKKIKNDNDDKNKQNLQKDLDLVQPFEKDIDSADPRPNLFKAGIKDANKHLKYLSNHELHQIKSYLEKDHKKVTKTIFDEPLGKILDNTINFLAKTSDIFQTKIYESELIQNIHSTDKTAMTRLKVYLVALLLMAKDDRNAIYMGLVMIFLSIIIYFIHIITFNE